MSYERVPEAVRHVLQGVLLRLRSVVVPWLPTLFAR